MDDSIESGYRKIVLANRLMQSITDLQIRSLVKQDAQDICGWVVIAHLDNTPHNLDNLDARDAYRDASKTLYTLAKESLPEANFEAGFNNNALMLVCNQTDISPSQDFFDTLQNKLVRRYAPHHRN